ncbi:MAG: sigma-70 family RNA polymerase sigma factor [Nitrospira sp.]
MLEAPFYQAAWKLPRFISHLAVVREELTVPLAPNCSGEDLVAVKEKLVQAFEKSGPKLVNRARRKCLSQEEAEDIVQDAVVWCLAHLGEYNPKRSSVKNWLYGRVDHEISLANRAIVRRGQTIVCSLEAFKSREDEEGYTIGFEPGYDPTYEYEVKLSVQQALAKLLPSEWEAAEAVLMDGLTIQEYADDEGLTFKVARGRVDRAKEKLKIFLSEWAIS